MKLRYSARFQWELDQTLGYVRLHSHSSAAKNLAQDVRRTFLRIKEMPLSGRLQQDGVSRKAVTPRYKYLIFYAQINAEFVEILTIQNPAQDRGFRDQ